MKSPAKSKGFLKMCSIFFVVCALCGCDNPRESPHAIAIYARGNGLSARKDKPLVKIVDIDKSTTAYQDIGSKEPSEAKIFLWDGGYIITVETINGKVLCAALSGNGASGPVVRAFEFEITEDTVNLKVPLSKDLWIKPSTKWLATALSHLEDIEK